MFKYIESHHENSRYVHLGLINPVVVIVWDPQEVYVRKVAVSLVVNSLMSSVPPISFTSLKVSRTIMHFSLAICKLQHFPKYFHPFKQGPVSQSNNISCRTPKIDFVLTNWLKKKIAH